MIETEKAKEFRRQVGIYVGMTDSYANSEGEVKKQLAKAIDAQLEQCIRIADELLREFHEEVLGYEDVVEELIADGA